MPKLVIALAHHRSLGQSVRGSKASRQALLSEFVDGSGRHFSDAQVG
jgi:hypothetical protein